MPLLLPPFLDGQRLPAQGPFSVFEAALPKGGLELLPGIGLQPRPDDIALGKPDQVFDGTLLVARGRSTSLLLTPLIPSDLTKSSTFRVLIPCT